MQFDTEKCNLHLSLLKLRGKPRLPYLVFSGLLIELATRFFSSSWQKP